MMKLYYHPKTRATRPHWMLEEVGAKYELVPIDLTKGEQKKPEYLKIHPLGVVPALQDGDQIILESAAIVAYLADKFPEKHLAPALNSIERGKYYQWLFFAVSEIDGPLVNYYLHSQRLPEEKRIPAFAEESRMKFMRSTQVLEDHLKKHDYLVGNSFTAADIVMGSLALFAKNLQMLNEFPAITKYTERLAERPAFKRALG